MFGPFDQQGHFLLVIGFCSAAWAFSFSWQTLLKSEKIRHYLFTHGNHMAIFRRKFVFTIWGPLWGHQEHKVSLCSPYYCCHRINNVSVLRLYLCSAADTSSGCWLLTKMPQCFLNKYIRSASCSYFYRDTVHFHLLDIVTAYTNTST